MTLHIDKAIHELVSGINNVKWNEFNSEWFDTEAPIIPDYFEYYYAESELYLVRHKVDNYMYLVKAKSPKEALRKIWLGEAI